MGHFIGFIILGLIAGWIGSKVVNKTGSGLIMDVVIGVVGAVVGGEIAILIGFGGAESVLDIKSLFIAVVGSIIVLLVYRTVVAKN